jgi:Arfaptin-like domain
LKDCCAYRIKYESLRSRVASMRAAQNFSRDATLLTRLREAETALAAQKLKYDRILNDLVVKLKFLEDNKVSVLSFCLECFQNYHNIMLSIHKHLHMDI